MNAINKRSIGVAILLSFVTFGIYSIYWQYLLVKNIKILKNDTSDCTGEMLCLIFVPFYGLYWWYTRGEAVKNEATKQGYTVSGTGILYLILSIFGLGIVAMAIMQNDFNSLNIVNPQSSVNSEEVLNKSSETGGMAIAGLVLGIVAIVLSLFYGWFSIIALPVAIVGLVLSAIARKKQPSGVATAGLVIGIIAVVISTIFFFACGICTLCYTSVIENTFDNAAKEIGEAIDEAAGGEFESMLNDIANQLSSIQ